MHEKEDMNRFELLSDVTVIFVMNTMMSSVDSHSGEYAISELI